MRAAMGGGDSGGGGSRQPVGGGGCSHTTCEVYKQQRYLNTILLSSFLLHQKLNAHESMPGDVTLDLDYFFRVSSFWSTIEVKTNRPWWLDIVPKPSWIRVKVIIFLFTTVQLYYLAKHEKQQYYSVPCETWVYIQPAAVFSCWILYVYTNS